MDGRRSCAFSCVLLEDVNLSGTVMDVWKGPYSISIRVGVYVRVWWIKAVEDAMKDSLFYAYI